jgi:hypothetical protein
MDWFFFIEGQMRDPAEDRSVSLRKLRDSLPENRRQELLDFLTAAASADEADLSQIDCAELRNGFAMVAKKGHSLREEYERDLRDFLS